ncbi:MAG: hypothetical protein ABI321_10975 [Polyangia bacterium]
MKTMTTKLLIGGALAAAATGGVLLTSKTPGRVTGSPIVKRLAVPRFAPVAQGALEAAPSRASAERTACRFDRGEELSYALSFTSNSAVRLDWMAQFGNPAAASDTAKIADQTQVQLHLHATRVDEQGAVMVARYTELATSSGSIRASDVAAPFLLRIDAQCRLSGFARLPSTPLHGARIEQGIAYELAFSIPGAEGVTPEKGENALGRYQAVFARNPADHSIQRRITAYDSMWEPAAQAVSPDDSFMQVTLGDRGWFEAIDSGEQLSTGQARSERHVVARHVATPAGVFQGVVLDLNEYTWGSVLHERSDVRPPMVENEIDKRNQDAVRNLTPQQSMDALVQTVAAQKPLEQQWPAMRAYLEAHPRAAGYVQQQLENGQVPLSAIGATYIALGRARTTQARDALYKVMNESDTPAMHRTHAALALIDRDDVGPELASQLRRETANIGSRDKETMFFAREAVLALGAMAGLKNDPEVVNVAKGAVQEMLASYSDATSLRPAFGALANIGDPSMLTMVAPFTRNKDKAIRAAATVVVRRMHPDDSAAFAAEWLAREPDLAVKRNLYMVLERQTFDAHVPAPAAILRQAQIDLASANLGVIGRRSIIRLLGSAAATDPAAMNALKARVQIELHSRSGLLNELMRQLPAADYREAVQL